MPLPKYVQPDTILASMKVDDNTTASEVATKLPDFQELIRVILPYTTITTLEKAR